MTDQAQQFPFSHNWMFGPISNEMGSHVKVTDQPSGGNRHWLFPIRSFDETARHHMQNREGFHPQPLNLGGSQPVMVPYVFVDEITDMLLRNQWSFPAGSKALTIPLADGNKVENLPLQVGMELAKAHVARRQAMPPVDLPDGLKMSFENFDAMIKNYYQRRPDMIACGLWPELVYNEPEGAPGPSPAPGNSDERANALGRLPSGDPAIAQQASPAPTEQPPAMPSAPAAPPAPPAP